MRSTLQWRREVAARSGRENQAMKVWVVKIGEQLPVGGNIRKMRALQLCEALAEQGHEVTWWTSAFDHFQKSWYFDHDTVFAPSKNFTIRAIRGIGYDRNFSLGRLVDHRVLSRRFARMLPAVERPDVIVISIPAHDVAYRFAQFAVANGIPYVIDARDKWPDSFVDIDVPFVRALGGLALAYDRFMARYAIRNATAHVAMSRDLAYWLEGYLDDDTSCDTAVIPLGFSKPAGSGSPSRKVKDLFDGLVGKRVVVFVGTFGKYHDPTVMIEAAKAMDSEETAFVIVGDGEMAHALHQRAKGAAGVHFTGWVDMDDIDYLLSRAHVGVCSTGTTSEREFFPNKVFLYLCYGLPVVSMFEGELRQLIDEQEIGFNFHTSDQLVSGLSWLFSERGVLDKQSEAATKLFNERFDSKTLMRRYCNIVLSVR